MALSAEDPMSIASAFLLQSPPGEINDVLSDVRSIIDDDAELEKGIASALEEYNLTQFTTIDVPEQSHKAIVCEEGRLPPDDNGDHRFLDPRSKSSFSFNHMELTVGDARAEQVDTTSETFRHALETQTLTYIHDHFHDGVASVFSNPSSSSIFTIVIVANKYNPSNFWSGRWRSKYVVDLARGQVTGKVLINVHYYEQGNVQLQTIHTPSISLPSPHPIQATQQSASKFLKLIETQEGQYQTSLANIYHEMGEKTFKGLRRALPMTRSKMDWDKVLGYKLGAELSSSNTGRFASAT